MNWWSFYSNTDGTFYRAMFSSSNPTAVALNTPNGYTAIQGQHDPATQKVDLATNPVTVVPVGS